jgi:hypothetical protein
MDLRSFSTQAKAPLTGAQQQRLERDIKVQEMRKEDEFEKEMKKAQEENLTEKERERTI